ncbi:type II toxin-antitoxin system VapC family toxin [Ursidibacter arcticus]
MLEKVLLDSNILITALNDKQSQAAQELIQLSQDPRKTLYITPLIRYEVLRGVQWDNGGEYQKCEAFLSGIASLNIDKHISDWAADIFRFEKHTRVKVGQQTKKVDKHNFDIMHFATAKVYGLHFISNDSDIKDWEDLYNEMQKTR